MGMYGYVWVRVGMYGYVWVCAGPGVYLHVRVFAFSFAFVKHVILQCIEMKAYVISVALLVVDHLSAKFMVVRKEENDDADRRRFLNDSASNRMEILIIIYHHAQKGIHVTDKVQPYNNAHRYMTDEGQFASDREKKHACTSF